MNLHRTDRAVKWGKVVLALWTLILLGVLLAPIGEKIVPAPFLFKHWDKVAHLGLFAITGFVSVFGVNFRNQFKLRVFFGAIFSLFIAVATECGQSLTPSRDMSLYDLLADVIGVGVGLAFYALLYSRYSVRSLLRL